MAEDNTGLQLSISNTGITFTNKKDASVKLRAGSSDNKLYLGADNTANDNIVATKADIDSAITLDKANYIVITNGNSVITTSDVTIAMLTNLINGNMHYAGEVADASKLDELEDVPSGAIYSTKDNDMDYLRYIASGAGTEEDPYVYKWDQIGTLYEAGEGISLSSLTTPEDSNKSYITISNTGVLGPDSSTVGNIAVFDNTTGKLIKDSGVSASSFPSASHTHTFTPEGTISTPSFTGSEGTATATYTPSGSVSAPTFSGTEGTASATYTPSGSVSTPTFTGTAGTASATYTPEGSISTPTFSGTASTISISYTPEGEVTTDTSIELSTESITTISSVGTAPSLSSSYDSYSETLTVTWSAGSVPTTSSVTVATGVESATVDAGFTGTAGTASASYTPSGSVSTPTFTGTEATISSSYTPSGSVSTPTFTGTEATISSSYTPSGSVSAPTFSGTEATISSSYTPSGTISTPEFSGSEGTTSTPS